MKKCIKCGKESTGNFCVVCGGMLKEDSETTNKEVKGIVFEPKEKDTKKEKNKKISNKKIVISYSIIGALSVFLIAVSIYAFTMPSSYETKIKELESKISTQKRTINTLENNNDGLINSVNSYMSYEEKANFLDEAIVFVIDGYGNYYYTYDQMEQVTQGIGEYSYWAYNKEQAIGLGYKAWE